MRKTAIIPLIALLNVCAVSCSKKSATPPSTASTKISITALIPASGSYNLSDTLVGTGFSTGDSVFYNHTPASLQFISPDTLIAKVPLGAGTGTVTVSGGGSTATGPVFDYVLAAVVSTLAGNVNSGYADGQGSAASFNYPVGIVLDPHGNLIVTDCFNNVIRKITPAGLVTTIAGNGTRGFVNGPAANAEFWWPQGVAVDGAGDLYIGDNQNSVIRKFYAAGDSVTTYAGNGTYGFVNGPAADAEFSNPSGVTMDNLGNLYVADANNCSIRLISSAGTVSTLSGTGSAGYVDGPAGTAAFHAPAGVTLDAQGNLYVADTYNAVIRKITSAGQVSTIAGNGTGGFLDGAVQDAEFLQPQAVAIDSAGNLLVGDYGNARVRKIATDGTVSTLAGTGTHSWADGPASTATFYSPWSMAVAPNGIIYVVDSRNNMIRKITTE